MRKLIWALVLVPCLVWGEEWLELDNSAGGKILFMKNTCGIGKKETQGLYVIATTPTGDNIAGCWYYFAGMVHVVWENGKTSSFEPKDFRHRETK
jgi:hypothetical protein